jgi:hypothetical protein
MPDVSRGELVDVSGGSPAVRPFPEVRADLPLGDARGSDSGPRAWLWSSGVQVGDPCGQQAVGFRLVSIDTVLGSKQLGPHQRRAEL